MRSTRREFLQRSAAAAAAATLSPLAHGVAAEGVPAAAREPTENPGVRAFEERMVRARPLSSSKIRVLGGPLKQAQDATANYLLELEPDRMLAFYRVRAGLKQKAEPYAGWDGPGRNLTGHIAGHYLSGVSLMYLATGDARFKARADYIVRELKEVQDKHGDGYLVAIDGAREAFAALSRGEIRSATFDLNGMWSPWYTLHKTYAGLRDAYRHTGNRTALDIEIKYAAWAERVLAPLTDGQVQRMLNTEYGGMNEVLADLYADTGNRRWLDLSYRFEHRAFTDPLKRHQDNLSGKHANCQIPKLMGSAARYGYTGDASDILAASFFWDRVAQHHSYATGGNSLAEYFGPPDQLSTRVDGRTCESCNVYNMLKLTRRLFSLRPDALYADFHERALFNHVLASIDPEDGRTSYMVPVGRGVEQEYQNMLQSFTCCVGTGMENHALHGSGVYYESPDTLWVNLFVPSTAQFTTAGVKLTIETGFPEGETATIKVALPAPKAFTLAIRRPVWAGDAYALNVNGVPVELPPLASLHDAMAGGRARAPGNEAAREQSSSFVELKRTWTSGDTIELRMPKSLRLAPTMDNRQVAAIMWGPLVLAGDLGPRRERRGGGSAGAPDAAGSGATDVPAPMLVAAERPIADWIVPAESRAGDFRAVAVARVPAPSTTATDLSLMPFYRTHRRNYSVYFDVVTPSEFEARSAAAAAERERLRKMEAATVGFVRPGETQLERDYNYRSDPPDRAVLRTNGRTGRGGTGWFSFDLPVDPSAKMAVVVTYLNELGLPPASGDFEILVDGTAIARFEPNATATGFYFVQYPVPAALVRDTSKVTVRLQAAVGARIAPVFGVRMVRAD